MRRSGSTRSTRFDWSGAIGSLEYKGHNYYGNWFTKITDIYDFGYEPNDDVISAEFTAMVGPAEEFGAIGYNDAKPGGLFVKPGIGALRRADETRLQPLAAVRDRERRQVGRQAQQRLDRVHAHADRAVDRLRLRVHEDHPAHARASRR